MTETDGINEALSDLARRVADLSLQFIQLMKEKSAVTSDLSQQMELIEQLQESVRQAQERHAEAADELAQHGQNKTDSLNFRQESAHLENVTRDKHVYPETKALEVEAFNAHAPAPETDQRSTKSQELLAEAAEERTKHGQDKAEALSLSRESAHLESIARKESEQPQVEALSARDPQVEAERLSRRSRNAWYSSERRENLANRLEGVASKEIVAARLRADACQAKPPSAALESAGQATSRPRHDPRTVQRSRGVGTNR